MGCLVSVIVLTGGISTLKLLALLISGSAFLLSLMMTIIGEYLWRTLEAARKRPPYIVDKVLD